MSLSVETITDYGAEPNPNDPDLAAAAQNRRAVREAAEAAGPGGIVRIPEGEFYIGSKEGWQLLVFGGVLPAGISIIGDGPTKSRLAVTGTMPSDHSHTLMFYGEGDHGTVSIKDIELHGNGYDLPNLVDAGRSSRGIDLQSDDISSGTWEFTNVLFSEWYSSATRLRREDWTFDKCTFRECGIQSRNDGASGHGVEHYTPSGVTNVVKNCKFENIASFAFNWRYGSGTCRIENCYAAGTGTGLVKLSAGGQLGIRNVFHQGKTDWLEQNIRSDITAGGVPFHGRNFINRIANRSNTVVDVRVNNVVGQDYALDALKIREPVDISGDLIALSNTGIDSSERAMEGEDGATITFDVGSMSVHDTNGKPVFDAPASGGRIDELRRSNTDGIGDTGSISISTDSQDTSALSPTVPSSDEVGINSETVKSGRDPAVFTTSFTDTSLDEFTTKWASTTDDWRITSGDSPFGGTVLELAPDSAGRHAIAWDDVGDAKDTEVLALVRVPDNVDDFSDWSRSYVRGGDRETAYFSALSDRSGFVLHRYQEGSGGTLGTSTMPEGNTWYWTRLRAEGDAVKMKHWRYDDAEPDGWNINATDSDISTSGWVGVGGFPSDVQQFDYLGVGVGGASPAVPTPEQPDAPNQSSMFDEWTPQWASSESDWSAVSASSNDGAVLELAAESAGRHALSWNNAETVTDVDILGLLRVPSNDDSSSSWCRLYGRGAGSAGNETGYFTAFRDPFTFEIAKYDSGGSTLLDLEYIDNPLGEWLFVRFNIQGDRLRARYWSPDDSEPNNWNLDVKDASLPDSGWVGVGGWSTDTQQWDSLSVATGGESAPFTERDNAPSVSWQRPTDGATASETATLRIDASDREDANGSLAVDYRIDGSSWRTANYSSDSGAYEATWETTMVADGTHTLEARATDSAGNTATETVDVITANDPVIDQFTVTDNSGSEWSSYDVDWAVSDAGADLDMVITLLRSGGVTVNAESTRISKKGSASGSHSLQDRGEVDEIRLVVNDTSNRVADETRVV